VAKSGDMPNIHLEVYHGYEHLSIAIFFSKSERKAQIPKQHLIE
jgi:hypothetical protein